MPDQDEISKFLAQDSQSLVEQHAKKYGVDPEFAKRILKQESGLRADVLTGGRKSSAGATGPMQLMPATARGLGVDHNDYEQNIEGGVKYLAQLHKQFGGDQTKIAAAYNAGPGAVQKYGGVPPYKETQNYVQKVAQPGGGASDIEDFLRQPEGAQPAPQPEAAPLRPVRRDQVPGPQKTTARGPVLPKESNPFAINQGATGFQQQAQQANARTGQISPEVQAEADRRGRELTRFNQRSTAGKVAEVVAQGGMRGMEGLAKAGKMAGAIMSPGAPGAVMSQIIQGNPGLLTSAAEKNLQGQEAAANVAMPNTAPVVRGTASALTQLPAAVLAGAGGTVPAMAGNALLQAGQEDWRDPKHAAIRTALGATLPIAGGHAAQAILRPASVAGRLASGAIGGAAGNVLPAAAEQVMQGRIDPQELAQQAVIGAGMGAALPPSAYERARPVLAERPGPLTRMNTSVVDEGAPVQGGYRPLRSQGDYAPIRPDRPQETQITKVPTGEEYARAAKPAEPQAAPGQPEAPAQATPSALPQERLAGIRVLGEAERVPMRDRARAKSIVYSDENGVPQNVRVLLPEGMSLGDAKRVLRDARKYQAQQSAEAAPAQPEATPATPENPRNRAISRGHEIEQQARAEADTAIQEGRHDDARAALKRRLAALQDTRANIKRDTPGAVSLRAQLGEQIFRTQEELRGLKTPAQRPVRPAPEMRPPGNEPTRDLTTPFPQAARVEPTAPLTASKAPARRTADLPAREQVQPRVPEAAQAPVIPATPTPAAQRPATSANARRRYGRGMDEAVTVHFENQADALRFDASKRGRHAAIGPEADQVAREFGIDRREAAGAIYDWRRTVEAAAKSAKPGTDVAGPSFAEFVRARQQAAAQAPEAQTPQSPTGPLTEPTNRLQGAEYAGGELPRTAGLRPEGQPVEAPAVALEHFRNAPSREEWDARAIPAEQATSLIQQIRAGIPESKRKGQVSRERATEDLVPVELPLSAIREDTRQWLRESTDQERVNRYAKNLPQTPIYAKPSQRGRGFIVDDGGHRVLAAIQRGAATIKALVPKSAYDRFVELSTDPIDTAPEAKPYEVSDQMARRRQEREAALKGPFGKFAEQARKFAGKEHALASHPEMRRLLDLPEMPDYKRDQRGWTEATHDTMNALAELADQPRSSHIDEDTIKGAWARLERRAEERKAPISDDLRETMADTWERHLTAQDNYQNFIVDGRIDNILRRLDQQHERPISTGEAAELRKAFIDTATKPEHGYELSKNLAEELWKSAKYDAATRAFTRGPRAAQEAVRGGSESARAADVRAEGRAERATGTYGRERDTGRGVSAEAPAPESAPLSDYKRFENANKKAIDTLRSVKPEEAATPAGQRRVDALISRLRKSADQMGVDQKHVDAVVTEAQNAQMEAARAADAEARPVEATPAPRAESRAGEIPSDLRGRDKHVQMTRDEFANRFAEATTPKPSKSNKAAIARYESQLEIQRDQARRIHETSVKYAINEGKPVPPEVLADYPDLQAKSAPPVAEMRPRAESEAKAAPMATEAEKMAPLPKTPAGRSVRRAREYAKKRGAENAVVVVRSPNEMYMAMGEDANALASATGQSATIRVSPEGKLPIAGVPDAKLDEAVRAIERTGKRVLVVDGANMAFRSAEGVRPLKDVRPGGWGGNTVKHAEWATDGHTLLRVSQLKGNAQKTFQKPAKQQNRSLTPDGLDGYIQSQAKALAGERGQSGALGERAATGKDGQTYGIIRPTAGREVIASAERLKTITDNVDFDEVRVAAKSPQENPIGFFKGGELQALLAPMRFKADEAAKIAEMFGESKAKPARKPRVKGSVGKLPNETEGGTTLGGGFGALQGMGKLFRRDTAPPKGAELDAWMDQVSRSLPKDMPDAAMDRLDQAVFRAADAAEAGDAKAWNQHKQEVQKILAEHVSIWEKASTLRKAGMLSRPTTHLRNILGNTVFQALEETARVPGAATDLAISALTGRRAYLGPSRGAMADAINAAATRGYAEAKRIMKTGSSAESQEQMQTPKVTFKTPILNKATDFIFRSLDAEDRIFFTYAQERAMKEIAKVAALNEAKAGKIKPRDVKARAEELSSNPTEEMEADALTAANIAVFRNDNKISDAIKGARNAIGKKGNFALDLVLPFDRTPTNIVLRALDYTPLGLVKAGAKATASTVRGLAGGVKNRNVDNQGLGRAVKQAMDKAFTPQQQRAISESVGRGTIGSGLIAMGYALAAKGIMTGFYDDSDKKGEAFRRAEGAQPGSVRVGDRWYQVSGFQPAGTLLTLGATLHRDMHRNLKDEENRPFAVTKGAANVLTDLPQLKTAKQLSDITSDPKQAGRTAASIVGSYVPGLAADIANTTDKYERDTRMQKVKGIKQIPAQMGAEALSRIPFARYALPRKKDITGQDVETAPLKIIDPTNSRPAKAASRRPASRPLLPPPQARKKGFGDL